MKYNVNFFLSSVVKRSTTAVRGRQSVVNKE